MFAHHMIDKASEYDYCMVLPSKDGALDEKRGMNWWYQLFSIIIIFAGLGYVRKLKELGLETFLFHSHSKGEVFVLIRARYFGPCI